MHDVVNVGIPLIAILAGILFNRSDVNGLRVECGPLLLKSTVVLTRSKIIWYVSILTYGSSTI